jgi:hypothetical protein
LWQQAQLFGAALKQERATFEANLYTRQIDAIAEAANEFTRIFDDCNELVPKVKDAANGGSQNIEELAKEVALLDAEVNALRRSPAVFALPDEYAKLYASIYSDFASVSRDLGAMLTLMSSGEKPRTSDAFRLIVGRRNTAYDNTVVFARCGAFQLRSGHYLTGVNDCPPEVKSYFDTYWPYVYDR